MHSAYASDLVNRGGPDPSEYAEVDDWIRQFYAATDAGRLNGETLSAIRRAMASILSPDTMHGWAYCKPYGYAGDFEIIDRHYVNYVSKNPHLANWDRYWQAGAAACAVRNRQTYFHNLLRERLLCCKEDTLEILNIASGPGRDVFAFLSCSDARIHFDCIDHDAQAIASASNLCNCFRDRVAFTKANVVRLNCATQYHVIWAAGLFDYFSDALFVGVMRRLMRLLKPNGQLVIGNFCPANPNRAWLRFVEWNLNHRSEGKLKSLAIKAGVNRNQIYIGQEPGGVNLFLHVRGPNVSNVAQS